MKEFNHIFSDKEEKELNAFYKKHNHPKMPLATAGGKFVYIFNPTGVGTYVSVKCLECKKEKNITDMENW